MDVIDKLTVLADAAKYDVACTSSGSERRAVKGTLGSASAPGICHSFAADGRCISLLKVLLSNACAYDCAYCQSRVTNECAKRATFTPKELADLTIAFYRRNYIEGLFLSSAVIKDPDHTCELMLRVLRILRDDYRFGGYIHVKAIPGADPALIEAIGLYADRMSINIEMPSEKSLLLYAPQKSKSAILAPMRRIHSGIIRSKGELMRYRGPLAGVRRFVPAGQSTQMIIGASPESDRQILMLSDQLYKRYSLRRVFYSAYVPLVEASNLPALDTKPPLLREHRLYQADWLVRVYGFDAAEILTPEQPNFNVLLDPKCCWALAHPEQFPVEVNHAPKEILLRVPGIGIRSAERIVNARRAARLSCRDMRTLGVVMKRAQYFLLCDGRRPEGARLDPGELMRALVSRKDEAKLRGPAGTQLTFFDTPLEEYQKCLTGEI